MAATSSGKQGRHRKLVKSGTTSSRKHRFESFNQRIAKLNIDPIRRRRRGAVEGGGTGEVTSSYFWTSLEQWKDLNLSESFTNFLREVEPLCQNLVQVLHYSQRIYDLLTRYIAKQDALSLQPLLDLLSNLAHDLDARFETYFSEAVTLVATLAAQHENVEVIEWSFTCIAWMFKYLSRLLLPDLKPLYNIMRPFLGKEWQKMHTTRFAAEAMSFLVRKAATAYQKHSEYLENVIDAIIEDYVEDARAKGNNNTDQYQYGIMTLLVNAVKGVDAQLHSSGIHVYQSLVKRVLTKQDDQLLHLRGILRGVTVALVHHSTGEGLKPILKCLSDNIEDISPDTDSNSVATLAQLLFLLLVVRKGSRIQDWQAPVVAGLTLLQYGKSSDNVLTAEVWKMLAVLLQLAPLHIVLPCFQAVMETLSSDRHDKFFLPFCNCFHELDQERFQNLLMPYLSKFIAIKWENYKLPLLLLLPKLVSANPQKKPHFPEDWTRHIIRQFNDLQGNDADAIECFQILEVLEYVSIASESKDAVFEALGHHIGSFLQTPRRKPLSTFVLGPGLRAFMQNCASLRDPINDWWHLICRSCGFYGTLPPFLEAILLIAKYGDVPVSLRTCDSLLRTLIDNLHSSSHPLRSLSLQIIKQIYAKDDREFSEILDVALAIENSRPDIQSARFVSMQVRKLASAYGMASSNNIFKEAIPHFCFGMLTYKLSQVQDDAVAALKAISQIKTGEDVVSKLAFAWLDEAPSSVEHAERSASAPPKERSLTEFECSNLALVEKASEVNNNALLTAMELLKHKYNTVTTIPARNVGQTRALALRVLEELPHLAEKRSRKLVPHLLGWTESRTGDSVYGILNENGSLVEDDANRRGVAWRQVDRKAMLNIFCQFTNPRVLYKSDDVCNALTGLLENGDVELQRSALKALFTWKLPELESYQDHLMNLLDDARFREEITMFINLDRQNDAVQDDHRTHLMPILLRLLYGKIVARSGAKRGQGGQLIKRRAVLEAIYGFDERYFGEFVRISLGKLDDLGLFNASGLNEHMLAQDIISVHRQLGLLNMMKSMLEVLGTKLTPFAEKLIESLLYCLIRAARWLSLQEPKESQESNNAITGSSFKAIRQLSLQCLNLIGWCFPPDILRPYLTTIFAEVLSPRLQNLPIETAQSVSSMLQLFSAWASSPSSVLFLVEYDSRTLNSIADCLVTPSCKDEVKLFVIDKIFLRVIECTGESNSQTSLMVPPPDSDILRLRLVRPNTEYILDRFSTLLQHNPSKDILASGIRLVAAIAPVTEGSSRIEIILKVSTSLLNQASRKVSPKSKGELLHIMAHFVPAARASLPSDLQEEIRLTVCSLFGYFKDRQNRLILLRVLQAVAAGDSELQKAASLCENLNAYSADKVDEPDFDSRLKAFKLINESVFKDMSEKQWRPLLFNMLFYIKDEELVIRSNASFALRRFVEASASELGSSSPELFELLKRVLLPALRNGVSESSELVRTEYLSIMAHLIRHNPHWHEVNDMYPLLVDNNDEASFFANILHIQQHRRLRALRRLATEASKFRFRSANVAHLFIPLIEHFIFDKADDEAAQNLSAESVITIGALAGSLEWPQFKAIFQRYSSYMQSEPGVEKSIIKLLGVVVDGLIEAAELKVEIAQVQDAPRIQADTEHRVVPLLNTLAKTMPKQDNLADALGNNLLPSLTAYLHNKDESTVSLRVPMSISVTKLLKLLPKALFEERFPPMLTDVCNILRSRAQESRDLSRKTLAKIISLVGPAYFGFVLKELRSALARGYQLHVLSFTVHSILEATTAIYRPGDLDYCLPQIIAVIMDDVFGVTGQEKDAEEYVSKMKEVKSSKSFDSMELITKKTSTGQLPHLIRPLQSLVDEKLDLRMVRKIDELLRRIGAGLLHNVAIQDQRILIFCHEIIRDAYRTGDASSHQQEKDGYRTKRFLISDRRANATANRRTTSSYRFKIVRFALDVLRTVLHENVDLQTPSNIHGFIPIIGDAIIQSNEEIQTSALRLLTTVIRVPLQLIDDNAGIYVGECVRIVKESASTNAERAQAALKLVSAILRERRTIEIRETDLAYLLKRLIPDLEEPDKQGIAFKFLKAIMSRKIVVPEVYEVLDVVGTIMVTNHSRSARDMARGAYFQFLTEYPQSEDRFLKQVGFVVRNLHYKHQEGRQSIMEVVHLLFTKVGEEFVQSVFNSFFVPLVMIVSDDESSRCREMAGALLKIIFERADAERIRSFLYVLRSWLDQVDQALLARTAIQIYSVFLDTNGDEAKEEVVFLQPALAHILKVNLINPLDADWELLYFALQALIKICHQLPTSALGPTTGSLWSSIRQCLSFPHAWVKLSAARLLGTCFADFARSNAAFDNLRLPLKSSNGLWLTEQDIAEVTRGSLNLLKVPGVSEDLASQSVRNLVFLGKIMAQTSMVWPQRVSESRNISEANEESASESEDEVTNTEQGRSALSQLVYWSCNILRRSTSNTRAPSLAPLVSTIQLLAVLTKDLPVPTLRPLLPSIFLPLNNLTDTSIPAPFSTDTGFNDGYRTLESNARELMSSLQEKLGTTEYVNILHGVREAAKERREGRRRKRAIERVANPEKAGRAKQRKGERKREKRKERSGEERGRRRGW